MGFHGENRDYFDFNNIWSRELIQYRRGQFSMASIQSNTVMEEHCQIVVGLETLFVGMYDGHGGSDYVSKYITDHFFRKLLRYIKENNQEMSLDILKRVASEMEEDILWFVRKSCSQNYGLDKIGSSCLVALIWREKLYILNIGDSRLLLGSELGNTAIIKVKQLTTDHNCKNKLIRVQVRRTHPNSNILKQDAKKNWRIKGHSKLSRSIGDAFFKLPEFDLSEGSQQPGEQIPFSPAVSSEPQIISRDIEEFDRCIIIASHGFWELMSNEQTALIVERNPRHGIAKKLLKKALTEAAKTKEIEYEELMKIDKGPEGKRRYHEDITVIVVFLNQKNWWRRDVQNISICI